MKLSMNSRHICNGPVWLAHALPQYVCWGVSLACCLDHQTFCGSTGPLEQAAQDERELQEGVHPPSSQGLERPEACAPTQWRLVLSP